MLATGTYTVTRRPQGTVGADGRETPAAGSTFAARLSVQPLKGEELRVASELYGTNRVLKAYGPTELRTADETTGAPADVVEVDGDDYEVQHVEHQRKLLRHYKATLVRVDR